MFTRIKFYYVRTILIMRARKTDLHKRQLKLGVLSPFTELHYPVTENYSHKEDATGKRHREQDKTDLEKR